MKTLPYYHVDVFTDKPFSGNGLTVFTESEGLGKEAMLKLTQEMRQFESIFLQKIDANKFRAYVFTCEEELDFAGHPILGAAATLHDLYQPAAQKANWEFVLNRKTLQVVTEQKKDFLKARMNQGKAEFGKVLDGDEANWLLESIGLNKDDLYPGCDPQIISTGLPYILIPLQRNGLKAKIGGAGLEQRIRSWGAMFIGIFEIPTLSIRTGDNLGLVEDIATGSLAGPSGAYLVQQGLHNAGEEIQINQGHNLGRPSKLFVEVEPATGDVYVSGNVCKVSENKLVSAAYLL